MKGKEEREALISHAVAIAARGVQVNDGHQYMVPARDLVDCADTIRALVEALRESETDWEYGIEYSPGNEEFEGQDLATIQRRVKYIRRQRGYYSHTVRAVCRRRAGDSLPVVGED